MALTEAQIRDSFSRLASLSVNSDLLSTFQKSGTYDEVQRKIVALDASTKTYNQEFQDQYAVKGDYQYPLLGTNQDKLILGFYFSYVFMVIVALFSIYVHTQSIQRILYGILAAGFTLFIITGILLQVA
jgi:hypothetical protein